MPVCSLSKSSPFLFFLLKDVLKNNNVDMYSKYCVFPLYTGLTLISYKFDFIRYLIFKYNFLDIHFYFKFHLTDFLLSL